ncbi:MAG: dicarboxylate/amino acid:cation symporter [Rubrivivax sp.]|nr:dicarboxylate/amino acid:cation symporter [Rubrivivax sp.]
MATTAKISLTAKIMIGMVAGAVLGVLINLFLIDIAFVRDTLVDGVLRVVGAIFVAALKMLVVPLVFVSLVGGVTAMGNVKTLGRIGLKALVLYMLTTTVAVTIALSLAAALAPGKGLNLATEQGAYTAKEPPALADVIIGMVPSNPVQAMAEGNMLQVIVFALLFGIGITLAGARGKHVLNFFNDLDAVMMKIVDVVMALAPLGIFALITRTFAGQGLEILLPMMGYFMVVVTALLIHAAGTFTILVRVFAGLSPVRFFSKMRPVILFGFSTSSSSATIPVNLKTVEERLGVDNSIASFTVPLGATINMDGTAIMQGVATVFIANVYAVDLGLTDYLMVVVTATLASIGTAGVPGVGLIMLAMVLHQVGLPVEGVALIIGVDRLLDMIRTAVNVVGDAAVSCVIGKSENALDKDVFMSDENAVPKVAHRAG